MIIGCKSALIKSQLVDRRMKGFKHFEIHTFNSDFIDINLTLEKKHWLKELELKAYALHLPLGVSLSEINPTKRRENMNLFKKAIVLTNDICNVQNPIIVLHSGGLYSDYTERFTKQEMLKVKKEIFQKEIIELNSFLMSKYPNISIGVENMPRFILEKDERIDFVYGHEDDICIWLKDLKLINVGTTLDICHAQAVCNYNIDNNINSKFKNIDAFLENYLPGLKLIHLSKGYNYIENLSEHGQPFLSSNQDDVKFLNKLFAGLIKSKYDRPITIETNETNIEDALNLYHTREAISNSLKVK